MFTKPIAIVLDRLANFVTIYTLISAIGYVLLILTLVMNLMTLITCADDSDADD